MPKFYEVYGRDVYDQSTEALSERSAAYCPFTDSTCDGGGNRHQTKIKLANSELRGFFSDGLDSVIPGICSIEYGDEVWIVCPRRLLGFDSKATGIPEVNHSLLDHEKLALRRAGVPTGVELGVWPEVYLKYGNDETAINYHFDFVIAPIRRQRSFAWLLEKYRVSEGTEAQTLVRAAKTGKYITGRYNPTKALEVLPDLENPTIIEVMTASTSGSDTEAGTDIASSFTDSIMQREHNCPGINKRQVWGRMATQLFAKSALAENWGGKTIWLVQNQLLRNIELTTRLDLSSTEYATSGAVNFLSMSYIERQKGINSLQFETFSQKDAGLSFEGSNKCTDILLPKVNPDKKVLLQAVLRRKLSAIIRL